MSNNKIDWDAKLREAEATLVEAEKRLAHFRESPEAKALEVAEAAETAAAAEAAQAGSALYAARNLARKRLGIIDDDNSGVFTEKFLAVAAEQIGCTLDEARDMSGINSFHGERVTGTKIYEKVLDLIESRILEDDATVIAVKSAYDAASERATETQYKRSALRHK